jgi:hypothetical protein
MTAQMPADHTEENAFTFDPAPLAAQVHTALGSYLRDRAPDRRRAFWKAVALGYGKISRAWPDSRCRFTVCCRHSRRLTAHRSGITRCPPHFTKSGPARMMHLHH